MEGDMPTHTRTIRLKNKSNATKVITVKTKPKKSTPKKKK